MGHSASEDGTNKFRKRISLIPVRPRRCIVVPVILSLASPSGFSLEWQFCPAPGMRRCCTCCDTLAILPVGTGLRSLRARPFEEEGYKREVTVYYYIMRRMGWECLGTLRTNCTGKCHNFCSICECSINKRAISCDLLTTLRRRNLGGGMTLVVLEIDICAMLEQ